MEKEKANESEQVNWKVVIYSIIALGFLALTFTIDWLFIIPAVVLLYLNQRELSRT
jgi:hypothetical protein